ELRGELGAALAAAALQDGAAGLRRHAGTEAVLALAATDIRLVGALHERRKGSSLPEKSPPAAGRGRQYSHASSTGLSTSAKPADMPLEGVSPTPVHSCGGILAAQKRPANPAFLPPERPLLCWPFGLAEEGRTSSGASHRAVCGEPLERDLRAASRSAERPHLRQVVRRCPQPRAR